MAAEEVYTFLKEQNRPFTANDVLQNVGKEHGKAAVQKCLDKLVAKNKIVEKLYGKQKLYCIVQTDDKPSNENEDALRKMDQEISNLTANLQTMEEQLHKSSAELKTLQSKITTEDAKLQKDELTEQIIKMKVKLAIFEENSKPISDEEKIKISTEHEKYLKEYRKRKRMCLDITNSILEGYPKTKQHLFEDIGIDTDEDVGFMVQ